MKQSPLCEAYREQILTALIYQTEASQSIVDMRGFTPFPESAQVGKVRMQMYALIAKMQLLGILPMDLHIKDGALVRHDEEEDPDVIS